MFYISSDGKIENVEAKWMLFKEIFSISPGTLVECNLSEILFNKPETFFYLLDTTCLYEFVNSLWERFGG